eukprot:12569234-Alexandrium_andersonii.AAC.1
MGRHSSQRFRPGAWRDEAPPRQVARGPRVSRSCTRDGRCCWRAKGDLFAGQGTAFCRLPASRTRTKGPQVRK